MPLLKTTKTLNCSCSSKNTLLTLKKICLVNLYIEYTSDGEDFISLQLVSYSFVLFCMTIKYV